MANLSKEQQDFWELLHLTREIDEQGTVRWYKGKWPGAYICKRK